MTSPEPLAAFVGPTGDEVLRDIDVAGRRVLVTGATSGIGHATARALARAGADVVISARDDTSGERAAAEIAVGGGARRVGVGVVTVDLADLRSVRRVVDEWDGPLDALICNAGIMAVPDLRRSPQGHELQLATNHLGHFLLATGLHDALAASGAARLVVVSSGAHRRSPVDLDDVDFERRAYGPWIAYGQSKTANILFTTAAASRWAGDGIVANACTPGSVVTNLGRFVGEVNSAPPDELKTVDQGAATSVLLSTTAVRSTGGYFADEQPAPAADFASDPEIAEALWRLSLDMVAAGRD